MTDNGDRCLAGLLSGKSLDFPRSIPGVCTWGSLRQLYLCGTAAPSEVRSQDGHLPWYTYVYGACPVLSSQEEGQKKPVAQADFWGDFGVSLVKCSFFIGSHCSPIMVLIGFHQTIIIFINKSYFPSPKHISCKFWDVVVSKLQQVFIIGSNSVTQQLHAAVKPQFNIITHLL